MALTKPILLPQSAFDAVNAHTFTFQVSGGNQVVKNMLTVKVQSTGATVATVTTTTYEYASVLTAGTLTNGTYYEATITTYDIADNSIVSDPIQFYCFSTPTFVFSNIPVGDEITNSSFSFEVSYSQTESERLQTYIYNLYDISNNLVSTSGELYASNTYDWDFQTPYVVNDVVYYGGSWWQSILASTNETPEEGTYWTELASMPTLTFTHLITALEDNTQYKIQVTGVTSNGMEITTTLTTIYVLYSHPQIFSTIGLSNNCKGGYITITSSIISIDGESNPSPPTYIDNSMVDLTTDGYWVRWCNGFTLTENFTLGIWGYEFTPYSTICLITDQSMDSDITPYRILIQYMYGYETVDSTDLKLYAQALVYGGLTIPYYVYSDFIDIPFDTEQIFIWLRKIGGIYEIKIENRGEV